MKTTTKKAAKKAGKKAVAKAVPSLGDLMKRTQKIQKSLGELMTLMGRMGGNAGPVIGTNKLSSPIKISDPP
jgi:hypothetical protein